MAPKTAVVKNIFDSLTEGQKDFFIVSLEKKVRNLNKKLREVKTLQGEQKEGKELNLAQLLKIKAKEEHQQKIKELEGIAILYLEAKAENEADQAASVKASSAIAAEEAATAIASLYFASQWALEKSSHEGLTNLHVNVFKNDSSNRIESAAQELAAYITGKNVELQAAVRDILALPIFAQDLELPVAVEVVCYAHAAEEEEEIEEIQQQQPTATQQEETVAEIVTVFEDATQAEEDNTTEPVQLEEQPTSTEEAALVQDTEAVTEPIDVPTTITEKPQQQPHRVNTRSNRQTNPTSGEHTTEEQPQGSDRRRGPRPQKPAAKAPVDDGWNVVKKGPTENTYKPRTGQFQNKENTDGERPTTGGYKGKNPTDPSERKPYNPENKKPYRERAPNGQYIRKDKTAATSQPSEQQPVEAATNAQ